MDTTDLIGDLRLNEPLANMTSWHVGGCAKIFYKPNDLNDLKSYLTTVPDTETLYWLGLGSNVLVRDGGLNGVVVSTLGALNKLNVADEKIIRAEAGVTCSKLAKFSADNGFMHTAFLAGIPGTVGGALAMNAGCYGGETWEFVHAVETIDRQGVVRVREPKDFSVAYRQVLAPNDEWFVAGHFKFSQGDSGSERDKIKQLLSKRKASQPIGEFSGGSVFKNPTGDHAGRLIESAGLKGMRMGGAYISEKHANFIINDGTATAQDIEKLINYAAEIVSLKYAISLKTEVKIMGEVK